MQYREISDRPVFLALGNNDCNIRCNHVASARSFFSPTTSLLVTIIIAYTMIYHSLVAAATTRLDLLSSLSPA